MNTPDVIEQPEPPTAVRSSDLLGISVEEVPMWTDCRQKGHVVTKSDTRWTYTLCNSLIIGTGLTKKIPKRICSKCRARLKEIPRASMMPNNQAQRPPPTATVERKGNMAVKKITGRKSGAAVRVERMVSLRLKRDDMLQVWRDAIVGHQTTINSRQKLQYDRIVSACDKILYPNHRRNKQANDPSSATRAVGERSD